MAGYYDKNKDYSKELQRTDLSASERERLTQERQNKIDDKYGGREPNMIGSDKTYSQTYGGSSRAASRSRPMRQGTHLPQLWARQSFKKALVSSTGQFPQGAAEMRRSMSA